jgi:hypothetical protein
MGVAGGNVIMPHLTRVRTRNFGQRDAAARIETTTQEALAVHASGTYASVPGEAPGVSDPPDWPPAALRDSDPRVRWCSAPAACSQARRSGSMAAR